MNEHTGSVQEKTVLTMEEMNARVDRRFEELEEKIVTLMEEA